MRRNQIYQRNARIFAISRFFTHIHTQYIYNNKVNYKSLFLVREIY